ncbi:MAG: anthranilate phosphoribosyltransferase [Chloroflexi bacterium]|nr:anthranilate phosphoribosyltransferase [Chloroflexota bacterium]
MIREAIGKIVAGGDLTRDEASAVMGEIMSGEATPAQIGALVAALRLKGETVDEIAGFATVMRAKATPVRVSDPVLDTCGTGGDGRHTVNVSTGAAFVAAGAGARVAKHGNRAMSSQCGSADVLEALGVTINLDADRVARCIDEAGIGFMFAPLFHPAMKYAAGPRREIGIRTVFNLLGPLTNPAGAAAQVLGVGDTTLVPKLAAVLQQLGCRHALVVHGDDGTDELSISGPTRVCEVRGGDLRAFVVEPGDVGLSSAPLGAIRGRTAAENAATLRAVFQGEHGPVRDVVLLNAAAALVAADRAADLQEGIVLAARAIDDGAALDRLDRLVALSQQLGT